MYPNPQDALPLPPRPNVEHYKRLAKDLVKSCRSGDPAAIATWAFRWVDTLAAHQRESGALRDRTEVTGRATQVEEFAHTKLSSAGALSSARCRLADAQFVIARAHGFLSWPKFISHIESLDRASSPVSAFEAAAHAVVAGDATTLRRLLREHPGLIRERSTREHRATLLHYVTANGVEPPLVWALTGWGRGSGPDADSYYEVVSRLVAAGANVTPDLLEWDRARADPKMIAALSGK